MMDSSFHRMRNSSTPPPPSRSVRSVDRELRGYHTARPGSGSRDRRQSLPQQERVEGYFSAITRGGLSCPSFSVTSLFSELPHTEAQYLLTLTYPLTNAGTLFGDSAANGQKGHAEGGAAGLPPLGLQPQPGERRPRPGRDHEAHSQGGG